jgi:hypothetical protein
VKPGVLAIGDGDETRAAGSTREGKHRKALTEQGMGRIDYLDQVPIVWRKVVEGGINL